MKCDRFHFLQEFLRFNGKANSSYDPNDGRRGCYHQVCLFTDMKLCRKLYFPKKQLSVGKLLVLFNCQLHFEQHIKTKRLCLGIKLSKLTSSNGTTINFLVYSRKRMFHNGDENSEHQKERLFTKYFFLLLVTPDIPPVLGNNDTIKSLLSVRYFS